jgi:hypothetical protein
LPGRAERRKGNAELDWMKIDSDPDNLRNRPRFKALLSAK